MTIRKDNINKKIHNLLLLLIVLFVCSCNDTSNKKQTTLEDKIMEETTKQLRHVVLFKFKETSTPEDIKKIEAAFAELPSKIKEIKGFEWGFNNSPEGLNKGLTHCFFLTFDSEKGRDIYLPHPAHKAFGEVITPHLEDVLVVDYWTK